MSMNKYGLTNVTVLDTLVAGADGMCCGLSEEGTHMGHACSAVALTNLARLGNKYVGTKYNTENLVSAARKAATATTGKPVPSKQVVYGSSAVDVCFSFSSIAQGCHVHDIDYDVNGVVNELHQFSISHLIRLADPPIRVSTLTSSSLITRRLKQRFGNKDIFMDDKSQGFLVEIKGG
jgi:hypothetical protein